MVNRSASGGSRMSAAEGQADSPPKLQSGHSWMASSWTGANPCWRPKSDIEQGDQQLTFKAAIRRRTSCLMTAARALPPNAKLIFKYDRPGFLPS
jgi:hypothetical protein